MLRARIRKYPVSPYTGEWIEIAVITFRSVESSSHLTQVSGLKSYKINITCSCVDVSPYTGEWIEISLTLLDRCQFSVSPYTGEWIEILLLYIVFCAF